MNDDFPAEWFPMSIMLIFFLGAKSLRPRFWKWFQLLLKFFKIDNIFFQSGLTKFWFPKGNLSGKGSGFIIEADFKETKPALNSFVVF